MDLMINIPITLNKEGIIRSGVHAGKRNFFVKPGPSANLRYYITDAIIREFKYQIIARVPDADADAAFRSFSDSIIELASEAEHIVIKEIQSKLDFILNSQEVE